MHSGPTRSLRLLGVPLLLTVTVGGVAPGAVTAARTAAPGPASVSIGGVLHGVAAVSARGGWAVGDTGSKTLIVRWNGSSWRRVPSPTIGAGGALRAVATVAGRAWAVGCLGCLTGTTSKTLIEHWNGKAWKRVSSPSPGTGASLNGVAAVSARSAWAVGSYRGGTLILHWDGRAWKRVHSPSPGTGASLNGVAAVSARDAWAVGHTGITGTTIRTLIERWNGKRWKRLPSPSPGAIGDDELFAVAALTARSAWAVGDISCGCGPGQSLIERWNGKVWKQVHGPTPRGGVFLNGVAAVSARRAWAVGATGTGETTTKTVILRWNGKRWKQVPSPGPRASSALFSVAATAARNAWAVGYTSAKNGSSSKVLIERWNGTAWK